MKKFNGKAIYNPSGKAGEYSYWACNFYNGCSNGCEYCYCKKGILAKTMGGDVPTLKKCFKDEAHALEIFKKELLQNKEELQKHSLFFSFSTDPMLGNTKDLTISACDFATDYDIPVKVLTKCTEWADSFLQHADNLECTDGSQKWRELYAFGFTLTGHDELELGASTNQERIEAMKKLHNAGFKTFASIEPIIDFESSFQMIKETVEFCDLYKIGFMSGRKYNRDETIAFQARVHQAGCKKIYWKDSMVKFVQRANHYPRNCVTRCYNLFERP